MGTPGLPFALLKYLYVGSDRFQDDLGYYHKTLGGRIVWHFRAFGTEVCAFDLGGGPLLLLAEHRPAGSVLPVWMVDDVEATAAGLAARGWKAKEGPFGIPDGDCYLFEDPSGNEHAVFGNERPDALLARYADPDAEGAIRHDDVQ